MQTSEIKKNLRDVRTEFAVRYLSGGVGQLGDGPDLVKVARIREVANGQATILLLDFGREETIPTRDVLGTWQQHCAAMRARTGNG